MGVGDPGSRRGHRLLSHTADIRLEAWGPDTPAAVEEAVAALIEVFADTAGVAATTVADVRYEGETGEDRLLAALDDVIYRLGVDGTVPVGVRLSGAVGALVGALRLAPLDEVEVVGPEPKALARSGLELVTASDGTVTARVTVDV